MDDLHARLLAAHEADDRHALVKLYTEAADQSGHEDQEAFFLTHVLSWFTEDAFRLYTWQTILAIVASVAWPEANGKPIAASF